MYNISEGLGVFSGIIAVYAIIFGFASLIGITLFVLQGLGLYNVSKKLNLNNPWICFIPVVSIFSLGRISDHYIKNDGRKSAKLRWWLLGLIILSYVILIAFFIVLIVGIIALISETSSSIVSDTALAAEIFSVLVPSIVLYLVAITAAVAYSVLYYIALWRTYAILDYHNATLFLVLSIFFNFLPPIFLFVLRNKEPKFTFEERMGIEAEAFEETVESEI